MTKLVFDPDISDSKAHTFPAIPELLSLQSCQYYLKSFCIILKPWPLLRPMKSEYQNINQGEEPLS